MKSPSADPTSLECALPEVLDTLRERANADPSLLTRPAEGQSFPYRTDNLLSNFGRNVFTLFEGIGEDYIGELTDTDRDVRNSLRADISNAEPGIHGTAMFEEAVALVLIRQTKRTPTAARVANVVRRSGGFIDDIATGGARHGVAVLEDYLGVSSNMFGQPLIKPVIDGIRPNRDISEITDRLDLFDLDEARRAVIPVGLEEHRAAYFKKYEDATQTGVCRARSIFDARREFPITEGLYRFMNDFAEEHVYPDFIPTARGILKARGLL